jgi:hypothetical protein
LQQQQQRAFEVILSMFVLTFHREAEQNEGLHNVGTQASNYRVNYVKLKKALYATTSRVSHSVGVVQLDKPIHEAFPWSRTKFVVLDEEHLKKLTEKSPYRRKECVDAGGMHGGLTVGRLAVMALDSLDTKK